MTRVIAAPWLSAERVAEAFANTKREDRAKDAYLYVLNNCKKPEERYANANQRCVPA